MLATFLDAWKSFLAVLYFVPFVMAPGILLLLIGQGLDSLRSRAERLLWSIVLSLPCSLVLEAILARLATSPYVPHLPLVLLAFATTALLLIALRGRPGGKYLVLPSSSARSALAASAGLLLYILFATASIQLGPHLFEGVDAADWSVRIPLVAASIRHGVPPGNPFFTVDAHSQPSRYYFFWYSLVAAVCRLGHLPARAGLTASVVWAAFSLVAMLFLALKHLAPHNGRLRRYCLLSLFLCCVMGMDILPTLAGLLTRPIHLYPEIEWWHADRIPSFLGAIIFAPHHIAGMVCCLLGFLVLVHSPFRRTSDLAPAAWPNTLLITLVAALCFAAAVGTSTYIAFCFAFVGLFYALDLLRQRRTRDLIVLLLAASLALLLSLPFLHELLSGPALPSAAGQHSGHFFRLALRELGDGDRFVIAITKRLHHRVTSRPLLHLLALPFVAVSLPLEFGFFLVPLGIRISRDLRRLRARAPFTDGERLLWTIFLGAAIPALFLSSEPTQGVNDLGRHAGLILRFVVIVWSAPICYEYLVRLRAHQPLSPHHPARARWILRFALVLLTLGLATQLWQISMDRSFLAIFHYTRRNPEMPFAKDSNLAGRYFDLHQGLTQVESHLPPDAVVQSNPGSRYQLIVMLYSDHPFAAADPSCESAFGGDPRLCQPIVAQLERLYGGPPDMQPAPLGPYVTVASPDAAATATPAAFLAACRDLHLAALVAQNSDPAWSIPGSWVWQEQPAFATPRVRIILCPAASPEVAAPPV